MDSRRSARAPSPPLLAQLTFLSHALMPHTFHALNLTLPSSLTGKGCRSAGNSLLCGSEGSMGVTGPLALLFLAAGFLIVCSDSLWLDTSASESAATLRLEAFGGITSGRTKGCWWKGGERRGARALS